MNAPFLFMGRLLSQYGILLSGDARQSGSAIAEKGAEKYNNRCYYIRRSEVEEDNISQDPIFLMYFPYDIVIIFCDIRFYKTLNN